MLRAFVDGHNRIIWYHEQSKKTDWCCTVVWVAHLSSTESDFKAIWRFYYPIWKVSRLIEILLSIIVLSILQISGEKYNRYYYIRYGPVNTYRPRQNGRNSADDIFIFVFIGTHKGLTPVRWQTIIWTSVRLLLIILLGTNCGKSWVIVQKL